MTKVQKGYYILIIGNKRWGAYSEDIYSDWNSHLMLAQKNWHPLGNSFKLQFLGESKVQYEPIEFDLPKTDINYGLGLCERCGEVYVKMTKQKRFCQTNCQKLKHKQVQNDLIKLKILKRFGFQCAGDNCKYPGIFGKKLQIWTSGDQRPYCRSCLWLKTHAKPSQNGIKEIEDSLRRA